MKLHSIDRSQTTDNTSFSVKRNYYPNFLKIWHYHPELELVYIVKSSGTRFIGDSIEKFEKGNLVLIGKNLPHMWLNDQIYFSQDSKLMAEAVSIHFKEDFLGNDFFELPEFASIKDLFNRAQRGISFLSIDKIIIEKIEALRKKEGADKLLDFIDILKKLSVHQDYKLLSSQNFYKSIEHQKKAHLNEVYEYIYQNFNKALQLQEIAAIVGMNPSAFSRYFKKTNRKTLTRYINEIRTAYACKLLMERELSITQICYECGYNSISNFNKQFKNIIGKTPSEYLSLSSKIA